jgi:hypothetical protein
MFGWPNISIIVADDLVLKNITCTIITILHIITLQLLLVASGTGLV